MSSGTQFTSSDAPLLDLLRRREAMTVSQLAVELDVTATAVRQRLTRLMGQGLVERRVVKAVRGRPSHHYGLTEEGRRTAGTNFHDLAIALWDELRAVKDPDVRRGLLQRVAQRLGQRVVPQVDGSTVGERMQALADEYRQRQIPFEVEEVPVDVGEAENSREGSVTEPNGAPATSLPVLKALACPYPDLAERDRTVCSMERIMLSELLETNLRLTQCRLDGGGCCTFQ